MRPKALVMMTDCEENSAWRATLRIWRVLTWKRLISRIPNWMEQRLQAMAAAKKAGELLRRSSSAISTSSVAASKAMRLGKKRV